MTPLEYGEILFPNVAWFGVALNLAVVPLLAVLAGIILWNRYVRGEEVTA